MGAPGTQGLHNVVGEIPLALEQVVGYRLFGETKMLRKLGQGPPDLGAEHQPGHGQGVEPQGRAQVEVMSQNQAIELSVVGQQRIGLD